MFTTKYLRLGIFGAFVFLLVGMIFSYAFLPNPAPIPVPVSAEPVYRVVHSEAVVVIPQAIPQSSSVCTTPAGFWRDFVDGNYYKNLWLGYCSKRGEPTPVATLVKKIQKVVHDIVTPVPPTEKATDEPKVTSTPNPTQKPTDEPTKTPKVTATPNPTQDSSGDATEEPSERTCHNPSRDNTNVSGNHNCSSNNPSPNSGQHRNKKTP